MTLQEAIQIVVGEFQRRAALRAICFGDVGWDEFPEIGEHDWTEITSEAQAQAEFGKSPRFDEAYQFLANRADPDA